MSGRYTSSRIRSGRSSRAAGQRLGAGAGDADRAEAVDLVDEAAVDLGDHEVVVDDQHVTHGRPADWRRLRQPHHGTARRRSGASLTSTVPPCWAVTSRTSARPMPRPPGTSGFEVTPRAKIASRRCSGTPGPESVTEIVNPSPSSMCTVTRAAARPTDTSTALSMRLPSRVITSVASAGSSAARCESAVDLRATRRSRRPAMSWRSAAPPRPDRRCVASPRH